MICFFPVIPYIRIVELFFETLSLLDKVIDVKDDPTLRV
jgi:hypothetical protein